MDLLSAGTILLTNCRAMFSSCFECFPGSLRFLRLLEKFPPAGDFSSIRAPPTNHCKHLSSSGTRKSNMFSMTDRSKTFWNREKKKKTTKTK